MNQNPTLKVLSSMQRHRVHCLLMGGQACVFYGAAEFSRDADFAVLAEPGNLECLQAAMEALGAGVVAVPPFEYDYLARGHAVHFRCTAPGVEGMRVDVMAKMRNVEEFPRLWERRTTLEIEGMEVDLLGLPDLLAAKKTQREKDWPMVQRLVESHWYKNRQSPTAKQIEFWLMECRTPGILIGLADMYPEVVSAAQVKPSVRQDLLAKLGAHAAEEVIADCLREEMLAEMVKDRAYWIPLKRELELIRRSSGGRQA